MLANTSTNMATNPTAIDDAGRFIDEYLRQHDLQGDISSASLDTVTGRADAAREQFKKSRPKDDTIVDHSSLTQSQKYRRRLENNKKSAAATRVFNEVLRKESARVLRDLEISERRAKEELLIAKTRLAYAEEEMARLNEKYHLVSSSKNNESYNAAPSPTSTHPYFDNFSAVQPVRTSLLPPQSASTLSQPRTPTTTGPPLFSFQPPTDAHQSHSVRLPPVPVIQKVVPTRPTTSPSRNKGGGCVQIAPAPSPVVEHATASLLASLRQREMNQDPGDKQNCDDYGLDRTHSRYHYDR